MKIIFVILFFFTLSPSHANNIYKKIERLSENVENSVVKWRRHIHQNPELSNREFMTAKYVSDHLKSLGLEVQETLLTLVWLLFLWEGIQDAWAL